MITLAYLLVKQTVPYSDGAGTMEPMGTVMGIVVLCALPAPLEGTYDR